MPPPAVPQLPPQMFTTAAQLLDLTDSEYLQWTALHINETAKSRLADRGALRK